MNSSNATTWKEWFSSRESQIDIDKNKTAELLKSFSHSLAQEECEDALRSHDETVFLYRQNFGEDTLGLFHHFTSIGGTVYSRKKESAFIQGIGENTSSFMNVNVETLIDLPTESNQAVPTQTNLLDIS